ncbi:cell wall-binding repeat-containing protein [Leifsonia sp. NPDC058292]|uniref:cell wall-binding repeat-containing protein n=1 Tax=Leifsonia sp. NPDC058292 TaxID=3346428 RepID=UPI0036D9E9BE
MRTRTRVALLATVLTLAPTLAVTTVAPASAAPVNTAATGDIVTASSLPSLLTAQSDDTTHPYSRDQFQLWIDADGNGCNTRSEVLIEESTTPVTVGAGCSLSGGTWASPYDGATWTAPSDVDIDHVVPLADAWRSGAWAWTAGQRRDYANDLGFANALIAVTDNVNQSKGDDDPAQWMPSNAAFSCDYVIDWALVKYRWSLTTDSAELAKLESTLTDGCGAREVTLPEQLISSVTPPTPPAQTVIAPFGNGTTRLFGIDRYSTAIAASQRYAPNVPAVFVAAGMNFPDALSAAAAAALVGGPLLITPSASLPTAVHDEIVRLAPHQIYVVGGAGAVSESVASALAEIAPTQRLGATDRYGTALSIVDATFTSSSQAIIATGATFPDALSATGAAGAVQAPVILVNGSASAVPPAVLSTLDRLGVGFVTIVGGTGAVSAGIQSQLAQRYSVKRLGGADRYATSASINQEFFSEGATTTFLAAGLNFPDALSGAAMAGRLGAPLYITSQACVPESVYNAINAIGATKHVVMGGTGAVSEAAAVNTKCVPPPVVTPPVVTPPGPPTNPGDTKNCTDFSTWAQAQAWFDKYFPYYGDIAKLDSDKDRIACEALPGHP